MAIGYVYVANRLNPGERALFDCAKRWRIKIIPINAVWSHSDKKLSLIAKKCRVAILNSAEPMAIETAKCLEYYGTKIINPTSAFYYSENKWMFYVKCRRHKIPVPHTILIPYNIRHARKELKQLAKSGAIIIKGVDTSNGDFVEKARNVKEAMSLIKKIRSKTHGSIIAQEYIKKCHRVYRVLVLGDKILQGVVKRSKGWKCTGNYISGVIPPFTPTPKLKKMCLKATHFMNLPWCGIDIMKKNNSWVIIEVNSSPCLEFVEEETPKLHRELLAYALKIDRKIRTHQLNGKHRRNHS